MATNGIEFVYWYSSRRSEVVCEQRSYVSQYASYIIVLGSVRTVRSTTNRRTLIYNTNIYSTHGWCCTRLTCFLPDGENSQRSCIEYIWYLRWVVRFEGSSATHGPQHALGKNVSFLAVNTLECALLLGAFARLRAHRNVTDCLLPILITHPHLVYWSPAWCVCVMFEVFSGVFLLYAYFDRRSTSIVWCIIFVCVVSQYV